MSWNPIECAAAIRNGETRGPLVFDLLDDWTVHPAFETIRDEVEAAYKVVFGSASSVVANSEGTARLARRLGRDDVELVLNGVDPERFEGHPRHDHDQVTVGYGGKIGFRLDLEIIRETTAAVPDVRFEFVGPVLDRPVARELRKMPNVVLLGDVHYDRYPVLVGSWDAAWAPHALGPKEVGGDLIKLYEYRAACLPTWSTKVIGWERALSGVRVCDREELASSMQAELAGRAPADVAREPIAIPTTVTWQHKTRELLRLAGL